MPSDFNAVMEQASVSHGNMNAALAKRVEAEAVEAVPTLASALIEYRELLTLTLPDRQRYLPWLAEGSNVLVFGPRGVGKTWFELGLASLHSSRVNRS